MSKFKVGDRVRKKDGSAFSGGKMVEEVGEWNFSWGQRGAICLASTNTWVCEESVVPAYTLTPGLTYTSANGNKWECIFVRDGKAWLVGVHDGKAEGSAYEFDIDGTASWVLEHNRAPYRIVFEPARVTVADEFEFYDGQGFHRAKVTFDLINGTPDWSTAKVTPCA